MIKIQIIFNSSSRPKTMVVEDLYVKTGFLCLQCPDGMIVRYPMMNIFSVCSQHKPHWGTCRNKKGQL